MRTRTISSRCSRQLRSFSAVAVENARIMIRLNEMNQTISGEKEQVEKAALASSWLAEHDSLTGLSNRRFLERVLDENIRLAALAGPQHRRLLR